MQISWLSNVFGGLSNGALGYVTPFSFAHHAKAFYMLVVSPVLTPDVALIDPGIVAFATDLSKPYPFYVHIVGIGLFLLAVLGFIKGIKTRETWSFAAVTIKCTSFSKDLCSSPKTTKKQSLQAQL